MSSLKKYEMRETSRLHLKDSAGDLMYADGSDGKPDLTKPIAVNVYGPGSRQYAKALNTKGNQQMDLLKEKGKTRETLEEAQLSNAEFLAACTHSFENIESENGHQGRDLAVEIYMNQKLSFIRDQIAAFVNRTENFTPGSSAT